MQLNDRERALLVDSLRTSRRAMAREFLVGALTATGQHELTLIQLSSLMFLEDGAEHTVKEMSQKLGRSMSATSRLLDQLVKRKLIRRWEDARDRRSRRVAISDAGKRFVATMMDRRAEAQLQLMSRLDPEEREQVMRGMALLAEAANRRKSHDS